jgi:hypothetical protein
MARKQWLFVAPALLVVGGGWKLASGPPTAPDGRIVTRETLDLEEKLGRHLYAPSWLPAGGKPGMVREGRFRVLIDYQDATERSMFIVAQEPRTQERDEYHEQRFVKPSDAKAQLNDTTGYFITGNSGERRLYWKTDDTSVIVSSTMLEDDEMTRVAQSVR